MIRRFFTLLCMATVAIPCVSAQDSQPFVMPVKASAFEIRNQELLRMGESALANRDQVGALGYFHELREKLSKIPASSDYVLASSLYAEACLSFPSGSVVALKGSVGVQVKVTDESKKILGTPLPGGVAAPVAVHRHYVCGIGALKAGDYGKAMSEFSTLWGTDSKSSRLTRLGDLHNWILLKTMQSAAALAETSSDRGSAATYWKQVRDLGVLRVSPLPPSASPESKEQSQVTVLAGGTLTRSPRIDVLEGEFLRLRGNALIELGDFAGAERVLRLPGMAIFPEDKHLMLLSCVARQGRMDDAVQQFRRCEQDFGEKKAVGWRQALWSMFSMYYEAGMYDESERYLVRLESCLLPEERYKWLMLRQVTLRGRLERLLRISAAEGEGVLVSCLDSLYNSCMKYSALFPDSCQPVWYKLISQLKGDRRTSYYRENAEMLYALGQVSRRAGNTNSASELFGRIGHSSEVSDALRYKALNVLGDISTSDIGRSIAAFKDSSKLKDISNLQRAQALYNAAQRALQEASRKNASADVRKGMGGEAENLLKTLCDQQAYKDTEPGREAAYRLGEYLYDCGRYETSAAYYERYYQSGKGSAERSDLARLRWSRCWRLIVEKAGQNKGAMQAQLQRAKDFLAELRDVKKGQELRSQAYLESYRVAFAMDDTELGMTMLDELLALPRKDGERIPEAFWIGLYERTLCHYQRNDFEAALKSAELFLQERNKIVGAIPWEQEFWLLLGDIQACRHQWKLGAEMYGKVGTLARVTSQALLSYGKYEQAYCLYMYGDMEGAKKVLEDFFLKNGTLSKEYAYRSAMLLGDVHLRLEEYMKAREHYVRAQGVFWTVDTFRSRMAMCRQGEVFLLAAEKGLKGGAESVKKTSAISSLERASEIFGSLMAGKGITTEDQDHYLDLLLRAQFRLGSCYELLMTHGTAEQSKEARGQALWCYQRVCDYFLERAKSGKPVTSSSFYVKSLARRVKLLTDTDQPVTYDTMEMIARLYDEYASLGLSGSVVAKKRAEAIRKQWKR